ncbi:sigma-54-dependent Fis family transcriptional regulator [Candidatus Dependentiae bacterium]|nr:sigma-54-dependent Fis family transcriptional regulator [Candidatus Dependentiae bacterium]
MKEKILIIEDEKKMREVLKIYLEKKNYEVFLAENGVRGIELVKSQDLSCVVTDLKMPKMNGIEVLKTIKTINSDLPVIIITAYGTIDTAIQSIKFGAYDYITKPFDVKELKKLINNAVKMYNLIVDRFSDKQSKYPKHFAGIVGKSREMREIFDLIERVSDSPTNVLILGESGTGKELVARAIHFSASKRKGPFIMINCAALPDDLLESELFGYEKSAFTGATQAKPGLFELADNGTLFLDEIAEMTPRLQAKLLRAIQEKEIRRLGATQNKKIHVRYITTTNRDIEKEIEKANFRNDLFFRINVVTIKLPPLRERREDIPLLVSYFIRGHCKVLEKKIKKIDPRAMAYLLNYDYPGNVRELENMIERAIVLTKTDDIKPEDLSISFNTTQEDDNPEWVFKKIQIPLKNGYELMQQNFDVIEKELIQKSLKLHPGMSNSEVADFLGTNRRIFELRKKKFDLDKDVL